MKKMLLSIALLAGLSANAQLANGSVAPNFTFTDLNGTSHTLYDYLDDGYTVILDVSAAWCGPCWTYHNTHAIRDVYEQHGPTGMPNVQAGTTNDAMVFYIEGQLTNTAAQLNGVNAGSTYATASQGNWVNGTTYPILDLPNNAAGQAFLSGYQIGYFPTIYKVCPNRIITEVGTETAANLYAAVGACPAPASAPADAAMLAYNTDTEICPGQSYTPSVKIQNNGTTSLANATVSITLNGTQVSTGTYTGTLATYGVATVTCSPIAAPVSGALVATVTTTGDAAASNGSITTALVIAPIANGITATVKVATDAFGSEFTWNIKKSGGAIVAQGGPYTDHGSGGQATPGTYPEPDVNFTLSPSECYTITLMDEYGDGFDGTPGNGSFKIQVNGADLVVAPSWSTDELVKKMASSGTASLEDLSVTDVTVYPNPASGIVNVAFEANGGEYSVSILDIAGRVVATKAISSASGSTTIEMPIADLQAGNYFVSVSQGASTHTQKLMVK
ncbi:T9SS type A sorting domain-containing protein [Fluviicola taffensis]|uniref:Alkyl hydroperoxide reductase/ Thiol specific antioxidant/ Mal allergen n=1 Tax=Fluviicola taffensis (strain DSM 16823 / NCIMB 13979 / RW262) TaxID=755732 RepID=F2IIB1_FLUTR|nr:T9SS type A sorting domain-containing protein [Fluviicola taffensis]AEA43820.1 alkyl hydroperoxide reductase/ Thiol specific antioxidant/ Mal allergen [Fluviicola taffensis DSM 16823]